MAGRSGEGWDAFVSSSPVRGPRRISRERDPVRIRYTSGTAGRPKGAVLTRGGGRVEDRMLEEFATNGPL